MEQLRDKLDFLCKMNIIEPIFSTNAVPIVLASDDRYVKYLSVAICSIIQNASTSFNYDIIILGSKLTENNQNTLSKMVVNLKNFSLRFFDLSEYIATLDLPIISYYSEAIYFRIFMPYIMPKYQSAIYLDCDLVLNTDIAKLFAVKLDNNLVGAVRDIGMVLHYHTCDRAYVQKEYFDNYLKNVNPDNYFNSGVLIMNLDAFRETFVLSELLCAVNKKGLKFPDQDGLNILCTKKTLFLDAAWNVIPQNLGNRTIANILKDTPPALSNEYITSRNNPFIIHFAMKEKPWLYIGTIDVELFDCFWKYAALSPYFGEIFRFSCRIFSPSEAISLAKKHISPNKLISATSISDIHYVVGSFVIAKLSNIRVKFEFIRFLENGFDIEGSTVLANIDELKNIKFWFSYDNKKHFATVFSRNTTNILGNDIVNETIAFKAFVPYDSTKKKIELHLWCSIYGVVIKKTKFNFSKNFPIDRLLKNQFSHQNGYILSYKNKLIVEKSSFWIKFKHEYAFVKSLIKSKSKKNVAAVFTRLAIAFLNCFKKKPLWLISDNFLYDDNGYAFFEYMTKFHKKDVNCYFAMSKESKKYDDVRKIGKIVFFEDKKRYKLLLLFSDWSICSVINKLLISPFAKDNDAYRDILSKRKFLFLQHGVITQDLSREHNRYIYNPSGFLTSTKPEYNSLLVGNYFLTENEVWLTGLPRFDRLYHNEKNFVTIMPTWRKYLSDLNPSKAEESFKQSHFFKFFFALVNSQKLLNACKELGYTLCLQLHPLFQKYKHLFVSQGNSLNTLDGYSYRQIYAESTLVVTDYSSAIFDFLYLGKPIFYTHFDKAEFFSGAHAYDYGYLDCENCGFGEVEYTLDSTVDRIISYMKNNCAMLPKYKERVDNFFAFRDKDNAERVYNKIIENGRFHL